MGIDESARDVNTLLLKVYDIAFGGGGMEVFNSIIKEIGFFFETDGSSLWIHHPNIPETITRIGYYQKTSEDKLSQLDYKFINQVLTPVNFARKDIITGKSEHWYYYIFFLRQLDLTGAYVLWFKNEGKNKEDLVKSCVELANKLSVLVNHFLTQARFETSKINKELFVAKNIQKGLIPTKKPKIPHATMSFRNLNAGKVGGDYLDIIKLNNNKLGLVVGDAMGKGIPSAFIMLTTRAVFRMLARANVAPNILIRQLNICLTPELIAQDMFVSLFYGVYDANNQILQYAAAGHNPPLLFRTSKREMKILKERGVIIGGIENTEYLLDTVKMEKGDILVIYTDGLTETKNSCGKQLSMEGVAESVLNYAAYDAEGICNSLVHALMRHCNNQPQDDVSFIVLKVE